MQRTSQAMVGAADLVVIESPGKLRAMRMALSKLGVSAEVTATLGHLLENPRSLRPLAIERGADGDLLEPRRQVAKPNVVAQLRAGIARCGRVVIATDDDQEGHVIAQDIATLAQQVRPDVAILRLRCAGLDPASVRQAWGHLAPLDRADALPGTARRLADRLIGAAYTDFGLGVAVGRVQAAVLGLCQAGRVSRRTATCPVPAADGGRPFLLTVELPASTSPERLAVMASQLPPVHASDVLQLPRTTPMNGGDALLALEADLGLTIEAAAAQLQELFEAGRISYPRTASRGMSAGSAEAVARLAAVRGILAFNRDALSQHRWDDGPHEAVRVLSTEVNLVKPLTMRATPLDAAEAALARRMIEAGVVGRRELGDRRELPLWARSGALVRDTFPRLPWSRLAVETAVQIRQRSPEAALVAAMLAAGVGRPSTWAGQACRLVKRQMVDDQLRLTPAGAACLEAAPLTLRQAAGSRAFEAWIDSDAPVAQRVQAALQAVDAQAALALVAVPAEGRTDAEPDRMPDVDLMPAPLSVEEEADEFVYRPGW